MNLNLNEWKPLFQLICQLKTKKRVDINYRSIKCATWMFHGETGQFLSLINDIRYHGRQSAGAEV